MALNIGDNFKYQGKKPNFERDSFKTLQEMRDYPASNIDEGHISYVLEDGKHYVYKTGEWVPLNVGGTEGGTSVEITQTTGQSTTAVMSQKAVTDMITEYNVSKLHPTGGIGGTNKYTLETAIAKIPAELHNIGIKCIFINDSNSIEEYIHGNYGFVNVASWYKVSDNYHRNRAYLVTSGNNYNTYIKNPIIGNEVEFTINTNSRGGIINCTNLINALSNTDFELKNLFTGITAPGVPSLVFLDKDLKVLQYVEKVNSYKIKKDLIPEGCIYICANSNSGTSSVYIETNSNAVYDTGISPIVMLNQIHNASKIQTLNKDITNINKNITTINNHLTIDDTYTIPTRNTSIGSAQSPITGQFAISRILESVSPGRIRNVHFDNEKFTPGQRKVIVLSSADKSTFKIESVTDVTINSQTEDLSKYNIDVPAGPVMISMYIDDFSGDRYGYLSSQPSFDKIPSKAIFFNSQDDVQVGRKFTIYNMFNYIFTSFYFGIEYPVTIKNAIESNQNAIESNQNDILEIRDELAQFDKNKYSKKNVVIFGDSITWFGNDDCSGDRGWTKYFKNHFKFASIKSYARSGATWTATRDTVYDIEENTGSIAANNCIYNQVNRMIDAIEKGTQALPDYIFVAMGTNDSQRGLDTNNNEITIADELGKDYSTDVNINTCTTFIKAMRFFHDQIWNVTKDAQIIILTPLQRAVSLSQMEKAATQIRKCAEYLSWPVIDQFKASMLSSVSESLGKKKNPESHDYTPDGLHPSARGAKFIGDWIAQQASSIMRI